MSLTLVRSFGGVSRNPAHFIFGFGGVSLHVAFLGSPSSLTLSSGIWGAVCTEVPEVLGLSCMSVELFSRGLYLQLLLIDFVSRDLGVLWDTQF